MIDPRDFIDLCLSLGIEFWTGVPCSYLSSLLAAACGDSRLQYIMATSEGEAIGIAAGARLASKKALCFCQNSGLGNMVNPVTSLNHPYEIPVLLLVSRRGGPQDEPQHGLMGDITTSLLDTIRVPWMVMEPTRKSAVYCLDWANRVMQQTRLPVALVIDKGCFTPASRPAYHLVKRTASLEPAGGFLVPAEKRLSRVDAVNEVVRALMGNEAVVATTGKVWRELLSTGYRDGHFYVLGSMGCAGAIGLGVHQASCGNPVVVLDGDGAALMKLGAMATIGKQSPERFVHVILDNEVYETTGAQPNASANADFSSIAIACGYRSAWRADVQDVAYAVSQSLLNTGPSLVHVKVSPVSDPRMPRYDTPLPEHARLFSRWLGRRHEYGAAAR